MDADGCAATSLALDEPQAGTAAEAVGWVVVEHDGAWMPRAPSADELGAAATDHLSSVPDVRLQLARPVRVAHDADAVDRRHVRGDAPRTVLLAHAGPDPADRWMRRLEVAGVDDLLGLDPTLCRSPTPPDIGEAVEHDVWLVCTHARRDACCALLGRPVALALALADHDVWETTHTGGHRFAGTALVLPTGLAVGRLDPQAAVRAAEDHATGRIDPAVLRGRCALPRPAQTAELALRTATDVRGLDDVAVVATSGDGPWTVDLAAGGGTWRATVEQRPTGTPRPVSDGAAPTDPGTHVVTTLVQTRPR